MTGDFSFLLEGATNHFSDLPIIPYALHLLDTLLIRNSFSDEDRARATSDLGVIGKYLLSRPAQYWFRSSRRIAPQRTYRLNFTNKAQSRLPSGLDEVSRLGLGALLCLSAEIGAAPRAYLVGLGLLDLPVPREFRLVFQEFASGHVNFGAGQ